MAHSGALDENKNSTWSDLLDPIRHSRTRATDAGHRPIAKANDAPDALEEHDALRTLEVHDAPSALDVLDVSIALEVDGTPCTFKVHTCTTPCAFEVGMAPLILDDGDALSALEKDGISSIFAMHPAPSKHTMRQSPVKQALPQNILGIDNEFALGPTMHHFH